MFAFFLLFVVHFTFNVCIILIDVHIRVPTLIRDIITYQVAKLVILRISRKRLNVLRRRVLTSCQHILFADLLLRLLRFKLGLAQHHALIRLLARKCPVTSRTFRNTILKDLRPYLI